MVPPTFLWEEISYFEAAINEFTLWESIVHETNKMNINKIRERPNRVFSKTPYRKAPLRLLAPLIHQV